MAEISKQLLAEAEAELWADICARKGDIPPAVDRAHRAMVRLMTHEGIAQL